LTCPFDPGIDQDIDLWKKLVQEVEILDPIKTTWKIWVTSDVLCSGYFRLQAFSEDQGWHSVKLITQTAPSYLYITHSPQQQQTIFTTISSSSGAMDALVALILNLYEEATVTDMTKFVQTNLDLPVCSIDLSHKERGDNLHIVFNNPVPLKELLDPNRYPEDQWDYSGFTAHLHANGSVEISRLHIDPLSGQARFVFSNEESFAAKTEIERAETLYKFADMIFNEFVGALAASVGV
jgi:hypothetical protein